MNLYTAESAAAKLPPPPLVGGCKLCWHVHDPMGDDVWQMMPRKTFAQLPEYWRCSQCGNKKKDFLVLDD